MRISDWSSDVCSSDLARPQRRHQVAPLHALAAQALQHEEHGDRRHVAEVAQHAARRCEATIGYAEDLLQRGDHLGAAGVAGVARSEAHTSELQSLMRISYAVFCLNKKTYTLVQQTY